MGILKTRTGASNLTEPKPVCNEKGALIPLTIRQLPSSMTDASSLKINLARNMICSDKSMAFQWPRAAYRHLDLLQCRSATWEVLRTGPRSRVGRLGVYQILQSLCCVSQPSIHRPASARQASEPGCLTSRLSLDSNIGHGLSVRVSRISHARPDFWGDGFHTGSVVSHHLGAWRN